MRVGIIHTSGSPCRCAEALTLGLSSLGHEHLLVDSEEVELRTVELARGCDLVIDHTDTYRGSGRFRSLVRSLLESHEIAVVGSDARACALADDKAAAKTRLGAAGIPTPPGIQAVSGAGPLPGWLAPPCILKPAFEHMSRGLVLARDRAEAAAGLADLLSRFAQPILVETFIPGREFAVSVVDGPGGLELLPPLEWKTGEGHPDVLTEDFKLQVVEPGSRDAARAELAPGELRDLEAFSLAAFRALGLRDYARFDVRLSPGGTFYFMEANVTPSMEPLEPLTLSARWAGMDFPALLNRILVAAAKRVPTGSAAGRQEADVELPAGNIHLQLSQGVHVPPPSTVEMAGRLDVRPGERVLELGCGSGLLSIAAAKMGAGRVVAVDIDPRSLDSAVENVRLNGFSDRINVRAGSWFEAVRVGERFDVIIATPPQTPGRRPFGPRYGGADGTKHLLAVSDGAPDRLDPEGGRLWIMAISIANVPEVLTRLRERFSRVEIMGESQRPFTPREYNELDDGLFDYLDALRARGLSDFHEAFGGEYVFRNLFIRAAGLKAR
ncbi:MAG TPA: 50S ribosomal protein L11 methyltransferase [Syntrophales bacterium]|nr:50S ribosomal protein L11 methyltransferase [Syntrophales bacterium]